MGERRGRHEPHGPGLTDELKAAAREALHLGARYAEAGRTWLNQRTTMMNQRPQEPRRKSQWQDRDHEPQQPSRAQGQSRDWQSPGEDYGRPQPTRYGGSAEYGPGYRGSEYGDPAERRQQQHYRDSGWQPSGRSYQSDQQGREYGYGGRGQSPSPYQDEHSESDYRGDYAHSEYQRNAPRAILGSQAGRQGRTGDTYQSDYTDWRRGTGRDYASERGYSGYHGQERHDLDEPGLGVGRYGGRRQLDTAGFGYDEDYPRRSELYGRGYGAGSGYTGPEDNPQQSRQRGESFSPGHRGRGPRQYTRSDERILEDVCERLTDDDYIDASDITVRVDSAMVTLSGEVGERWMKHRAEDIADACSGVRQVENRIRVQGGSASQGSHASRSGASGGGNAVRSESESGSTSPGNLSAGTTPSSGSQTH